MFNHYLYFTGAIIN